MNNKAQIEMDMSTIAAAGMGLLGGFISLFVIKEMHNGVFFKMIVFLVCTAASALAAYFIFNKD